MATEPENARLIAERIARRLTSGQTTRVPASPAPLNANVSAELASVRAGLGDLQDKLARLEAKLSGDNQAALPLQQTAQSDKFVPPTHSPWLAGVNATAAHPSQEKFGVEEAVVSQLVDFFEKEKLCSMEPGGKPCDHCAMCNSRGF